jgi:hypothetical protein
VENAGFPLSFNIRRYIQDVCDFREMQIKNKHRKSEIRFILNRIMIAKVVKILE